MPCALRRCFPLLCRPPILAIMTEPQNFFRQRGTAMAVITIPFEYDERTHPTIVPICIADTDSDGNAVHRGWIDLGVVPVVNRFFKIAERLLADKFRASEIAEYAVHSLSRTHGDDFGDRPSVRVLNSARLYAADQRAGGRRLPSELRHPTTSPPPGMSCLAPPAARHGVDGHSEIPSVGSRPAIREQWLRSPQCQVVSFLHEITSLDYAQLLMTRCLKTCQRTCNSSAIIAIMSWIDAA